jgi:type III pantothenate kinase
MQLLVDAGNSRLKAALCDGGELTPLAPFAWDEANLTRSWTDRWSGIGKPDGVWCANVAGADRAETIRRWCHESWGILPEFLRVGASAAGVSNGYRRRDQLGIDRWLAAVAGFNQARRAVCIVDCGTAINAEFVTAAGEYLGGMIAPGPRLMSRSLASGTAALPDVRLRPDCRIGDDTDSCVSAGISHAVAGLMVQIASIARTTLAADPVWLLTGGDAAGVAPLAPVPFTIVPDLVLQGVAILARSDR